MQAIVNFLIYLATSIALLSVFMFIYEKSTPYREFQEIRAGNIAAAIAFSGAILGFIFPLLAAIYYTHNVIEMAKWAAITGVVQLILFQVINRITQCSDCISEQRVAPSILLATLSIAVGMLNAISISY